jgi:hypothetical protein
MDGLDHIHEMGFWVIDTVHIANESPLSHITQVSIETVLSQLFDVINTIFHGTERATNLEGDLSLDIEFLASLGRTKRYRDVLILALGQGILVKVAINFSFGWATHYGIGCISFTN